MRVNAKEKAIRAKEVSSLLAASSEKKKNDALEEIAHALMDKKHEIIAANEQDLEISKKNNLSAPLLKRLKFDEKKLNQVIEGIYSLIKLPDPVGQILSDTALDHGLDLYKVSSPIGVIGIIFESRPDALVQISTLGLKSGNCVLLKGGSEAEKTNKILTEVIVSATQQAGIPDGWIHLLETRSDVNEMLKMDNHIDMIIPRGSNEFVRYIMDHSNIPVLGHADGICHVYIDDKADIEMAVNITTDSKTQYFAVCNAAETLLVHKGIANKVLPLIKEQMDRKEVELIGCENTAKIIEVTPANEQTWKTEYLDKKLSVKIVDNTAEAIDHINHYGSAHTDAIVSSDEKTANDFLNLVDSANVFWNCSTRFSDGYRYGLGAEVGISTNKIHARGPVGLEGLLIYKWKLKGRGQIVQDYSEGNKKFIHKKRS
jgi:glutamate-5-semialdehyde dehydrogenase